MSQQKQHQLTPAQIEELESDDSFLRGHRALAILNTAVKETGVVIPADYVFKDRDRSVVTKAMNSVFELIGGVPKMLLWANTNQNEFYKMWAKQMPTEQVISGNGNIVFQSNIPASSLDEKEMDAQGFVSVKKADGDQ